MQKSMQPLYKKGHRLEHRNCPVCNQDNTRNIGIRGNREYNGADQTITPHIYTQVVQCRVCKFIYTNPEIRGLEYLEDEHYSDAENYMKAKGEAIHSMFATRLSFIKNYTKPDQDKLLDVGAGKGEFLFAAAATGFAADGVEPSANFCAFGKEAYGVNLYHGLLGQTPALTGKKYDVITMHHVLEHVEEPVKLINLIKEYLAREGMLFIEVPNCNSYLNQLADLFFRIKGLKWSSRVSPLHPPFHKFGYTPAALRYLLEGCGYKVIATKTFSGKDRSSFSKKGIKYRLASVFSTIIGLFGNRELLCMLAAPANNK
jgi:SAM-dependent methyltransferase